MKYRESGMPPVEMWDTFFNPIAILTAMGIDKDIDLLVDIGCGYGTFLLPAAKAIGGRAIGIDVDPKMVEHSARRATELQIDNINFIIDDVSCEASISRLSKHDHTADYVMLFNMLHCEEPNSLIAKAKQLLKSGGRMGVIHWKHGKTPRGPSMKIRPTPEVIIGWANESGFALEKRLELPPYHFGLIFKI